MPMAFTPQSTTIPTIHNCNLNDPDEVFLWLFTCPPGLEQSGAELIMPPGYYRQLSRRLVEGGAVLDLSRVSIKYTPPRPNALLWEGMGGKWSQPDKSRLKNGAMVFQSNPEIGGEYL